MKYLTLTLVTLLGHDDFTTRELAQATIQVLHHYHDVTPALPRTSTDPEVKKRLTLLHAQLHPWPPERPEEPVTATEQKRTEPNAYQVVGIDSKGGRHTIFTLTYKSPAAEIQAIQGARANRSYMLGLGWNRVEIWQCDRWTPAQGWQPVQQIP